jgi:hypothetical protein
MRANGSAGSCFNDGNWRPPKAQGKNVKHHMVPYVDDPVFHHHCGQTQSEPQPLDLLRVKEYSSFSLYHYGSNIWLVNYDATTQQVHDGNDNDTLDSSSDTDSETEDEHGQRQRRPTMQDNWSPLRFRSAQPDRPCTLSFVTYDGEHERLLYQHKSHEWAEKLFTDQYEQTYGKLGSSPDEGGLVGELPILIGLLALAMKPEDVQSAIAGLIRSPPQTWEPPDDTTAPRRCGCEYSSTIHHLRGQQPHVMY